MALSLPAERADRSALTVPGVLAAGVVLAQIAYPITPEGGIRHQLTVATVTLFFAASVAHAGATRGWRFAALLVAVTAGGGLLVESVGVATGVPFGSYRYTDSLGSRLLGVPLVIPLAWTMMGYPAFVVGQRLATGPWTGAVAAGWALAAWDLFLDPQMVAAGHWAWEATPGPDLLGVPVLNFVGWFVVATAMMAVLRRIEPIRGTPDDHIPIALYLWTYASSVLAHAAFFDLPGSAAVGGLGMGVVVIALARTRQRR